MASTTTLKYGPKISLSHVTMKGWGRGGPDPFIVKDYENGPFFLQPSLIIIIIIIIIIMMTILIRDWIRADCHQVSSRWALSRVEALLTQGFYHHHHDNYDYLLITMIIMNIIMMIMDR